MDIRYEDIPVVVVADGKVSFMVWSSLEGGSDNFAPDNVESNFPLRLDELRVERVRSQAPPFVRAHIHSNVSTAAVIPAAPQDGVLQFVVTYAEGNMAYARLLQQLELPQLVGAVAD